MARHYASTRFPTNPADLGRALADPERFADLFPDAHGNAWAVFEDACSRANPRLAQRIAAAEQLAVAEFVKGSGP
jgi:hypothetical protein